MKLTLLVVQGRSRDCVVRCSDTFETTTGTLLTLGDMYRDGRNRIKCSIDGLILLESGDGRLRMWNPSIRKFRDIPTSPKIETSHDIKFSETKIGLAYDPLVKDYMYVKIVHGNRNQPPLVAVYTLGAGSWKIIPFQVKEGFVWDFNSISKAVCLRDSLYFLVDHLEREVWELGSFDMSSEVFCSISLLEDDADLLKGSITLVRNGCSSLALFHYYDSLTMWVFESMSMCWTEAYESGLVVPGFLYLKTKHDILMWSEEGCFTLASKTLKLYFSLVSSCNLETKEEKILPGSFTFSEEGYDPEMCEVYGYIESLVLLK